MGDTTLWYTARGAGTVSLLLLTAVMVMGLLTTLRFSSTGWPRFLNQGFHRNLALMSVVFVAVHVVTIVLDTQSNVGWFDVLVPFFAGFRPFWVGMGTIAVDLLVALTITSLLQRRMGYNRWRVTHWAAYACWPVAVVHGLETGTDATASWMLAVDAACVASVVMAAALRWWPVQGQPAA